jgi:adenosine kinase
MTALICGSLAFDTIMSFDGKFSDSLLPDQLHKVNVSFLVPTMRSEFGGCAGNIAYNLKLLGGAPLIMGAMGHDCGPYLARFESLGIPTTHILKLDDSYTAQCFVTADSDNNQLTAFHPGAMMHAHLNHVRDAQGVKLAIVAPDGRDAMLQHAKDCHDLQIPFIFDPGHNLRLFDGAELRAFVELADYLAVNDYEAELMMERTGLSLEQIAGSLSALIVTRGELGSEIYAGGERIDIPGVQAERVVDPTGCGDAYRAGLMYGMLNGMDWATTGRIASLMGALKIAHQGGQNHAPSRAEIAERFEQAFGYRF